LSAIIPGAIKDAQAGMDIKARAEALARPWYVTPAVAQKAKVPVLSLPGEHRQELI